MGCPRTAITSRDRFSRSASAGAFRALALPLGPAWNQVHAHLTYTARIPSRPYIWWIWSLNSRSSLGCSFLVTAPVTSPPMPSTSPRCWTHPGSNDLVSRLEPLPSLLDSNLWRQYSRAWCMSGHCPPSQYFSSFAGQSVCATRWLSSYFVWTHCCNGTTVLSDVTANAIRCSPGHSRGRV